MKKVNLKLTFSELEGLEQLLSRSIQERLAKRLNQNDLFLLQEAFLLLESAVQSRIEQMDIRHD